MESLFIVGKVHQEPVLYSRIDVHCELQGPSASMMSGEPSLAQAQPNCENSGTECSLDF